jgi:zinc and cadmium transporter
LIGDAIHNFIDGVIIAASYTTSLALGMTTTIAIILHEIPQELGDFGVLVYGGFGKIRALIYNFFSQLMALVGGLAGYYVFTTLSILQNLHHYLLPFAAGGFLYIAASDLIPELHKEKDIKKSLIWMTLFLLGLGLIKLI